MASFTLPYTTNLVHDFDAGDIDGDDSNTPIGTYPDGTFVDTWVNRGSGGDAVEVSGGGDFTNPKVFRDEFGTGKHGLYFDGGLDRLEITGSATSMGEITSNAAFTLFIAFRIDTPNTVLGLLSSPGTEGFQIVQQSTTGAIQLVAVRSGGTVAALTTFGYANRARPAVLRIRSDGTSIYGSVNGGSEVSVTLGTAGTGTMSETAKIGIYSTHAERYLVGCIGRIAYYDENLGESDRNAVTAAFMAYYDTLTPKRSYVFLGDSLTMASSSTLYSYPIYHRLNYGPSRIHANFGRSGDTIAEAVARWDAEIRPHVTRSQFDLPPVVCLQIGVNDIFNSADSAATMFATMRQIADDIVADNAAMPATTPLWQKMIWMTVGPFGDHASATQDMIDRWNALNALILAYEGDGITVIDINDVLESENNPTFLKDGTNGEPDYKVAIGDVQDGLHYNDLAREAVAEWLHPYLADDGGAGSISSTWNPSRIPGTVLYIPTGNLGKLFTDASKTTNATAAEDQIRVAQTLPDLVELTAPSDGVRPILKSDSTRTGSLAFTLSTANRYAILSDSASILAAIHQGGPCEFVWWGKYDLGDTAASNIIFDNCDLGVSTNKGFTFYRSNSGETHTMFIDTSAATLSITTSVVVQDTNWHRYRVRITSGTLACQVQIDDGPIAASTFNITAGTGDSTYSLHIGIRQSLAATPARCQLSEILFSTSLLSEESVYRWSRYNPDLSTFDELAISGGYRSMGISLGLGF